MGKLLFPGGEKVTSEGTSQSSRFLSVGKWAASLALLTWDMLTWKTENPQHPRAGQGKMVCISLLGSLLKLPDLKAGGPSRHYSQQPMFKLTCPYTELI